MRFSPASGAGFFARQSSVSRPEQSYALALGEVLPAIEAASTSAARLDMRAYECVS